MRGILSSTKWKEFAVLFMASLFAMNVSFFENYKTILSSAVKYIKKQTQQMLKFKNYIQQKVLQISLHIIFYISVFLN